jgi:two-component system nitrogen regulation sensor histidine kinase NtrY
MKFLFRKLPYIGWLLLCALLLSAAAVIYQAEQDDYKPSQLARIIENDFNRRNAKILADFEQGLFATNPEAVAQDETSPDYYLLQIYRYFTIIYWNDNSVSIPINILRYPKEIGEGKLVKANNRLFYLKQFRPTDDTTHFAFTLIPIATDYTVRNKYYNNTFYAGASIPEGTTIAEHRGPNGIEIKDAEGNVLFYVHFPENLNTTYVPGIGICVLFFASLLSFAIWLHKICIYIGRRKYPVVGWLILFFVLVSSLLCYGPLFDLPFYIRNTELFSPKLLSSGDTIGSFGDLILLILADAWIYAYLFLNVPIRNFRISRYAWLNRLVALLLMVIIIRDIYVEQIGGLHLMITDSKIPFEVTDFSNINIYTIIGLFAAGVITFNAIVLNCVFIELSKTLTPKKWVKYVILSIIWMFVLHSRDALDGHGLSFIAASSIGILLIEKIGFPMRPAEYLFNVASIPSTYIWFAMICSWITAEVFYFNYNKEKDLRKVYAQKLEHRQDIQAEFAFADLQYKIAADSLLINYFKDPTPGDRINFSKHLSYEYLSAPFKKYRSSIYLYDRNRQPIFNSDTADRPTRRVADSIAMSVTGEHLGGLIYLGSTTEGFNYWASIAMVSQRDTLGFLEIGMGPAPTIQKLNDPLYFQSNYSPADQQYFDRYSEGTYKNDTLVSGENQFPFSIDRNIPLHSFVFDETINISTLFYRISEDEVIAIMYKRRIVLNIISLFSYVLAIVVCMSICYFLLRNVILNPVKGIAIWRQLSLTIRAKVNFTILVTVFLSFVVLGIATVSYLISRYRENQEKDLRNATNFVSNSVIKSIENTTAIQSPEHFSDFVQRPEYAYQLMDIAEGQNVHVNIFNAAGILRATSQQDFNQKGYLSRIMNKKAIDVLSKEKRRSFTHLEKTGNLQYRSSYATISNSRGEVLGYVNVPYYTSLGELQDEISNILAMLINLYTIIFFLSGLAAIIISNNVIRSFNLLIDQFKNIRLRHNEPLQWPYKDEIGMLVSEYNAMIQKVEGMATRLAHSEREAAWREIAKQIAHEIKNPLTPMKLQIQYLQQSIKNGRSDITPLAQRVAQVLLEQIEHLSIIASEFSSFAKLPDANPERIDALAVVQSVTDLYKNHESVKVLNLGMTDASQQHQELMLWIDKSYLIRILTNIIQNAVQAIPDDRDGLVEVSCNTEAGYGVITVKDNGIGITNEVRRKLFVPNFTTKSSGTGLGLSMTKNMIEFSNGSILVDTEVGMGTSFVVRIPLAD